jgi:hypothetical protein
MEGYEIGKAAEAAGVTVAELKNWLRQGVVKYKGEEPRPSYPRVFPLAGVYEIALLAEMVGSGFDRGFASKVVGAEIDRWQGFDEKEGNRVIAAYHREAHKAFEGYRDVRRPVFWVIASDQGQPLYTDYADGADNIPKVIAQLQKGGKPYLLASANRGSTNAAKPGRPFGAFGIVNLTAALARVDTALK